MKKIQEIRIKRSGKQNINMRVYIFIYIYKIIFIWVNYKTGKYKCRWRFIFLFKKISNSNFKYYSINKIISNAWITCKWKCITKKNSSIHILYVQNFWPPKYCKIQENTIFCFSYHSHISNFKLTILLI